MAVKDLVTIPSFSGPASSVVQSSRSKVEETTPFVKEPTPNYGDPYLLRELSFPGNTPLVEFVRGLPNPRKPFAVQNLEYIKALKHADQDAYASADRILAESVRTHDPNRTEPFAVRNLRYIKGIDNNGGEGYQSADRMIAALVLIAAHRLGLKTEPIEFLKGLVHLKQKYDHLDSSLIGTRLDQLKARIPGSRDANGPYNENDRLQVRRLAPLLAFVAIDAFTEGDSFVNREHENPQPYRINSNDLSMILKNIFDITKNH